MVDVDRLNYVSSPVLVRLFLLLVLGFGFAFWCLVFGLGVVFGVHGKEDITGFSGCIWLQFWEGRDAVDGIDSAWLHTISTSVGW